MAWFGYSDMDRAAAMLHELGHAYDYIYGPGSSGLYDESGTEPQMKALSTFNAALVREKCFR